GSRARSNYWLHVATAQSLPYLHCPVCDRAPPVRAVPSPGQAAPFAAHCFTFAKNSLCGTGTGVRSLEQRGGP
ncbi:MAG: hypothetical protein ACXWCH_32125, partial [Burkholderiales bacterium]